jgi:hypothetical protein
MNTPLNTTPSSADVTAPKPEGFKQKVISEAKQAFALTLYFGSWFCALSFLAATALDERPIPLTMFGFALIKAGICAKFMLIGQAIYPINVNWANGIIKPLFLESLLYLLVVLLLNYIEVGLEGVFHGKNFFDSLGAFGHHNPDHVLAMAIVYWLIVWPYLVFIGLKDALGNKVTLEILFGKKSVAIK